MAYNVTITAKPRPDDALWREYASAFEASLDEAPLTVGELCNAFGEECPEAIRDCEVRLVGIRETRSVGHQ